jgi:hypothetical protein
MSWNLLTLCTITFPTIAIATTTGKLLCRVNGMLSGLSSIVNISKPASKLDQGVREESRFVTIL